MLLTSKTPHEYYVIEHWDGGGCGGVREADPHRLPPGPARRPWNSGDMCAFGNQGGCTLTRDMDPYIYIYIYTYIYMYTYWDLYRV